MKHFFAIVVLMMMLSYGFCNSLYINFDNIEQYKYQQGYPRLPTQELKIDAQFNEGYDDNRILITITYLNEQGEFILQTSPFYDFSNWKKAADTNYYDGHGKYGNKQRYSFYFNKAKSPSSDNPCAKIDRTNDYLCQLRLMSSLSDIQPQGSATMLYLRITNSTAGKATVKIFGGMHEKTPNGDIYQTKTYETGKINLGVSFKDAERTARERVMVMSNRQSSFLSQTRLEYLYFTCQDGLKKFVKFNSEDLRQGNVTVNLPAVGMPFDDDRHCTFAVMFIDVHTGTNFIPMQSNVKFLIRPDPNHDDDDDKPEPSCQEIMEKYKKQEKLLKETKVELAKLEGFANMANAVKKLQEIHSDDPKLRDLIKVAAARRI